MPCLPNAYYGARIRNSCFVKLLTCTDAELENEGNFKSLHTVQKSVERVAVSFDLKDDY